MVSRIGNSSSSLSTGGSWSTRLNGARGPTDRILPEPAVEEELAGVLLVVARPLEAALGLESSVAHAGVHGRQRAHLVPDVLGGRVAPVVPMAPRQVDDDVEVVARLARRLERAADALDAPLASW